MSLVCIILPCVVSRLFASMTEVETEVCQQRNLDYSPPAVVTSLAPTSHTRSLAARLLSRPRSTSSSTIDQRVSSAARQVV